MKYSEMNGVEKTQVLSLLILDLIGLVLEGHVVDLSAHARGLLLQLTEDEKIADDFAEKYAKTAIMLVALGPQMTLEILKDLPSHVAQYVVTKGIVKAPAINTAHIGEA